MKVLQVQFEKRHDLGLSEINTIDFVVIRNEEASVDLVLTDDHDWNDEHRHCELLERKLNRYLDFLESDESQRKLPDLSTYRGRIVVKFLAKPPIEVVPFLENIAEVIRSAGFDFVATISISEGEERLGI